MRIIVASGEPDWDILVNEEVECKLVAGRLEIPKTMAIRTGLAVWWMLLDGPKLLVAQRVTPIQSITADSTIHIGPVPVSGELGWI